MSLLVLNGLCDGLKELIAKSRQLTDQPSKPIKEDADALSSMDVILCDYQCLKAGCEVAAYAVPVT